MNEALTKKCLMSHIIFRKKFLKPVTIKLQQAIELQQATFR